MNATQPQPRSWHQDCEVHGDSDCPTVWARASRETRWIAFDAVGNATLARYRVGPTIVAESIQPAGNWGNSTLDYSGYLVTLHGSGNELMMHDDPTGLLRFKGDNGSLLLTFPAEARVQPSPDGRLARITYADRTIAHFRTGNATWIESHIVLVHGFGSLAVQVPSTAPPGSLARPTMPSAERTVGAEVSVATATSITGEARAGILAYDDVDVSVQIPESGVASARQPIRVNVASDLTEGKTIVINLAREAIANASPAALELRYFDVHMEKDGGAAETEIVFGQASGLADVLDPADDGGQPEYWLVADSGGIQLLVSVPHWSEHVISVALVDAAARAPDVALGIGLGIAGSVAAAIALFRPRRGDDT